MKTKHLLQTAAFALALAFSLQPSALVFAAPLGTAFTYQGRLTDGANPAQGIYDLRFAVYDAGNGGTLVVGPITNSPVSVTNGLFTVTLDFGSDVFTGEARWLEIGVRTNGSTADFTLLTSRQPMTPTPYAIRAANFSGTVAASQITGTLASSNIGVGTITSTNLAAGAVGSAQLASNLSVSGTLTAGTFQGNGAGLTNISLAALPTGIVTNGQAGVNFSGAFNAVNGMVIENRTSDPPSPAVGQIWLRTDL